MSIVILMTVQYSDCNHLQFHLLLSCRPRSFIMTRKVQLWVAILFTVCLQHLAAYPYPTHYNTPRESKDNWRYPYHYNTQLGQTSIQRSFEGASSNSEQPSREDWGRRYKDYASEAKYYNAYDRKTMQAVETDRIRDYFQRANAAAKLKKGSSKEGILLSVNQCGFKLVVLLRKLPTVA